MAVPLIQIIPQVIQRAVSGTCYACSSPALFALQASVVKQQQGNLQKFVSFQMLEKDLIIFGACLKHHHSLAHLRAALLRKEYYFTMPK